MKTEAEVVAECLIGIGVRYPETIRAWRQNTGAFKTDDGRFIRFGVVGQADISGLFYGTGRRLEIECKTKTGKLSDAQKAFQAMVEFFGGVYIVVRDPDEDLWPVLDSEIER